MKESFSSENGESISTPSGIKMKSTDGSYRESNMLMMLGDAFQQQNGREGLIYGPPFFDEVCEEQYVENDCV